MGFIYYELYVYYRQDEEDTYGGMKKVEKNGMTKKTLSQGF